MILDRVARCMVASPHRPAAARQFGRILRASASPGVLATSLSAWGCAQLMSPLLPPPDPAKLSERAVQCLQYYVRYEHLATARAQAIEALHESGREDALPWIRLALHDEEPAVRFAAMMALGERRDTVAEEMVRKLLASDVASDHLAAIFVLHRLGDSRHTAELAACLVDSKDIQARRHAALILGRLGEQGAVKLLARAMGDSDTGLRANALESMAMLGADEARKTLYAHAYGGIGADETFAVSVLGRLRLIEFRELFQQKLESALHLETRLAAARALGWLGYDDGLKTALKALNYRPTKDEKNDPTENQALRVHQLAALALGAIGDRRALGGLRKMMDEGNDPRVQIAAAKAILDIVRAGSVADGQFERPMVVVPPDRKDR